MYWNYRVLHRREYDEDSFIIVEVYYDSDNSIIGWTKDEIAPYGETIEELTRCYEMMAEAFSKPPLNEKELLDKFESTGAF